MLDMLIRGGLVVTPETEAVLDVGIRDGRIEFVAPPGFVEASAPRVVEASGRLVLPGGVEAHAHIAEPLHRGWTGGREVWLQGPAAATRAAAFGGTTTVASFAFMGVHAADSPDPVRAVEGRIGEFRDRCYVDFTFHPALVGNVGPDTIGRLREAIQGGIPTFKAFTTCVTTAQHGVKMEDGPLLEVMAELARSRGLLFVHAEDDELVTHMEAKLKAEGRDQWFNLHLVHTSLSEEIAFRRTIRLAREHGTALYFVHVTAEAGVVAIAEARATGQPVYGEVLHNYLAFTAEDYRSPDGGKIQTYPALKTATDREALWAGLAAGTISTVATDEYTTDYATKVGGRTVETACGGHAGIETRGLITYTEGVASGRLSLRRFVEVFSSGPAKLLGLYPRKGAIAVGSDADLVIWDPGGAWTISLDDLHHDSDYSIWEGWRCIGRPRTTMVRGKLVVDEGRLVGDASHGQWLTRSLSDEVLVGPGA